MNKLIQNFIADIKTEFKKDIEFKYIYDDNFHLLFHSYEDWYEDINFRSIIGKNIEKHFYKNSIFNISVSYDYDYNNKL